MSELEQLLWKRSKTYQPLTIQEKKQAHALFEEWRDRLIAIHARHIRLCHEISSRTTSVKDRLRIDAEWSNAAIHLLTIPSETVQDWFLRSSPAEKDKIVQAVLRDRGIMKENRTFIELPPLD